MKKLIISLKTTSTALEEIKTRLNKASRKKGKVKPHYEISFTNTRDLKKFIGNIDILTHIHQFNPGSIYELAKIMKKDAGQINRAIKFFESLGVIKIQQKVVSGRNVKTPIVEYEKIEFDLAA